MTYGLSAGEKGAFFGCEVLPIRLFRYKKCFFCDLVGIIYNGGSILADISFLKIAKSFASLLAVGLAIWIALQVLGHVSSLTKQDAPKFLGNLLRQSFKVLFAIVLLYYPKNIFDYAFSPLLNAGLEFGEASLASNALGNLRIPKAQVAHGSPGGKYLSNETYREVEYFVKTVNAALSQMQAVGGSMMCMGGRVIAMNVDPFTFNRDTKKTQIVDGLAILTQGALMVVFGWLLSIAFIFYLLDAIIQMGVVGGLLPFMVAAWPFKVTSNYTKVGVDMFMNSVFTFAFIGLIVSIDITLIDEAMALNGGGLREIAQAFHDNDTDEILRLTDITGMGLLILLFCCIYGFKFLGEASSLAGKFASGALTGKGALAPKIATMGASAAKNLALGATKDLRKAAGDKMGAGIKAVANSPYNLAKAGINKLRNRKSKDKE